VCCQGAALQRKVGVVMVSKEFCCFDACCEARDDSAACTELLHVLSGYIIPQKVTNLEAV
jgi:hypothetical protein